MELIHSVPIDAGYATKSISVFCGDVTRFDGEIDILTTSAFVNSYAPSPRTVFKALHGCGIHVDALALAPEIDLRKPCHTWLSKKVGPNPTGIKRIGCVELIGAHLVKLDRFAMEQAMINSIRAYFQMLDIASFYGVDMTTVALPLLGSGQQNLSGELLLIPLINECISFLKRNHAAKNIYFIEINPEKANLIARSLSNSLRFSSPSNEGQPGKDQKELAFISYSSKDKNIADNLCAKLEHRGVKVWYAPRDVNGPYAESIVHAINSACYFIVILSENSITSEHVLNEIDLAFQNLSNGMKFKPLRIDNALFTPSFKYYLSRQHWMDATIPPLEERLNEFVNDLLRNRAL